VAQQADSPYLFDNAWEGEGERLEALGKAFDPGTHRHLLALGLDEGWRCLEVGAGAGGVARWMAERVGPKGRVVATDISIELLGGLEEAGNVEVLRHNIAVDPLPEGEFDLVHSRLVLEHVPEREEALGKMAAALAPGGWLVVEDLDWGSACAATRRGALVLSTLLGALRAMLKAARYDERFGRRLPVLLQRLGLTDVGAEGRVVVLVGGTASIDWARPTLERIRGILLGTDAEVKTPAPLKAVLERLPPVSRFAGGQLDKLESILADPEFAYLAPAMVACWGRRPSA
jgi:SAM-dependent methyltransferase